MNSLIFAPSTGLETWKGRLADPDAHWVRGKSAFETAVFWENGAKEPRGLHRQIASLLDQDEALRGCRLLASFPEHRTKLVGGSRASQTDVWAILRAQSGLVSLAIEGKAGESFGETTAEWLKDASAGKKERLTFLAAQLGLDEPIDGLLRYQLLHRTAAALLEAERIGADIAAMIVASFADDSRSKADFERFVTALGGSFVPGRLVRVRQIGGRSLLLGWLDLDLCTDAAIAAIAV